MSMLLTLSQYILRGQTIDASGSFTSIMEDMALGCRITASKLRYGTFDGLTKKGDTQNASGDAQVPLDILANNIFIDLCENNGNICAMASEELDEIHYFTNADTAKYIVVIDPLDGSSNIDINAPVATIFSLCKVSSSQRPTTEEVIEAARHPVAAGICVYGAVTTFTFTSGNGVQGFTQDLESGVFFHTHADIKINNIAKEVAINFSNRNYWNKAVLKYVDECFLGEMGPRKRYFNTRWYASAAAELYRILLRGGVFMYPSCSNGKPQGVLRKLYEAWPMAMLIEQAGGSATNGVHRILDLPAKTLHEKTPFAMGTTMEIELLTQYHNEMGIEVD